jgi:hypothetical protein
MAGPANPRQPGAHDYHIHVLHTGEYIKPQTIWLKFCAFCAFLWQSTEMLAQASIRFSGRRFEFVRGTVDCSACAKHRRRVCCVD